MLNRKIEIKLVKDNKKSTDAVPQESTPDYVKLAEEAAIRIGKKLLIGTVVVIATTVVVSALADIAVNAMDNITE